MPDMSWEHASEARSALHAIVTDPSHGVAALSNPQTMSNLLTDLLPDAPREKVILVAAAEARLASVLRGHIAGGMDGSTAIRLTSSSFAATTPFTPEACDWVTGEIAFAMGVNVAGDAVPAGGAAETSAPGSLAQVTQPPASPGYQDPSHQPTAPAATPATVRPDQGVPSDQPALANPAGVGQASGGSAGPAPPPGWHVDPDGKPTPARRKRSTAVLIVAVVVVAAAGVTAGAVLASASGSGLSGAESFVATSSSPSGSPLAITLVGVFSASGTETVTGRDRLLVRLPGGTFAGITRPQKASVSLNSSTCLLTIRQPGTFTTGHGTGRYAGIAGSGTYHVVYTATFRRASNGTCETSSNSVPVQGSVTWVVHGGGPVTLP